MKKNNGVSRGKRKKVFIRDNYRCWYCGCQVFEFSQCGISQMKTMATVDHIEARILGGDHSLENLVTSCLSCNSVKGTRSVEEFRSLIQSRTREGEALKTLQQSKALIYTLSEECIRDHFDSIERWIKSKLQIVVFYGEQKAGVTESVTPHSTIETIEGICLHSNTNQKEESSYVQ